jgi:hypothetical protein
MSVSTFEGIVERGEIRLPPGVRLPENAKVYVVVPSSGVELPARLASPRLVRPEEANDFRMTVTEAPGDAGV